MKTKKQFFVCLVVFSFLLPSLAIGEHVHEDHESHDGYTRTENWESSPDVPAATESVDLLYSERFDNCDVCPDDVTATFTTTKEHSVTVGGSTTVGAKASLGLGIKTEAHASVTLDSSGSGTWSEEVVVNRGPKTLAAHEYIFYKTEKDKYSVSGASVESADCKITCICSCGATVYTYCNKATSDGDGTGYESRFNGWYGRDNCH